MTTTCHPPHAITELPGLNDEPLCEIRWQCPDHGTRSCGEPARWALLRPCTGCGSPLSTLLCDDCRAELLRRGDALANQMRRL